MLTAGAAPYLNYFTLPGNERYYDFTKGNIHFLLSTVTLVSRTEKTAIQFRRNG
ncbi:MAG: hypothetical protein IPG09_05645 [Ignavibacteria bacterium]|nr:hypothetical protein [Ignavibacteria bacterium]